jgi:hypothetical protein
MDGHLDLLGLDAVRAGDATPEQRAHAEQCAECRALIEGFHGLAAKLTPARFEVPAEVSRRILRPIPQPIPQPKRSWRPLAAAAAALLVAVGIWFAVRPRKLDIVDAYSVALRLRNGQSVESTWDLNADGKVDARDVDEIARRSVAIR